MYLTDEEDYLTYNNFYKRFDSIVDLLNEILEKIIGNGIMLAYPFFVLSTILTY